MNLQQRIHERINDLEARHPGQFDLTVTSLCEGPGKRHPGRSLFVSTVSAIGFELPLLRGDDVRAVAMAFEVAR